jgi:hypothetical protein
MDDLVTLLVGIYALIGVVVGLTWPVWVFFI